MTTTSKLRGHEIYWDGEARVWRYSDTREPTAETWQDRPCGHCGRQNTVEGHDGCLGTLPGVANACCGHGDVGSAYIQYPDGTVVSGIDAINEFTKLRIKP